MEPSRLFARLYLDEDVHVRVARIVQGHGYDARTGVCESTSLHLTGAGDAFLQLTGRRA